MGFEKFLLKNLLCTLEFGSVFILIINVTPLGIICGRQWESFGLGLGLVWGSFAVLYSSQASLGPESICLLSNGFI